MINIAMDYLASRVTKHKLNLALTEHIEIRT